MSKTRKFDIESNEPQGTTFEGNKSPKFAGAKNRKRPDEFGIVEGSPHGTTFVKNGSHVNLPDADGTPKESKVISAVGGQGSTYKAAKSGPEDFGGSEAVGASSKKSGKTMSTRARL